MKTQPEGCKAERIKIMAGIKIEIGKLELACRAAARNAPSGLYLRPAFVSLWRGSIALALLRAKAGGERGIRTPQFPADNKGNPHDDSQRDSQISVPSSPELSQVVTAWDKLPAPLKAAILAIINSAEGRP